jgi:hypothetical protein
MKLVDVDNPLLEIILPADLLWVNEFDWSSVKTSVSWGLTGALIVQKGQKLSGRPIKLKSPMSDMGWASRSVVEQLRAWAEIKTKRMTLHLEKATDTRTFLVAFDEGDTPIRAVPVKGWADHLMDDPYTLELSLMTIPV